MNMREMSEVIEDLEARYRHLEQHVADLSEIVARNQEKLEANAERLNDIIG